MTDISETLPESIKKHGGKLQVKDLGWGHYYVLTNDKTNYRGFIRIKKQKHIEGYLEPVTFSLVDLFNDYFFVHDIHIVSKRKKYG